MNTGDATRRSRAPGGCCHVIGSTQFDRVSIGIHWCVRLVSCGGGRWRTVWVCLSNTSNPASKDRELVASELEFRDRETYAPTDTFDKKTRCLEDGDTF